MDTNSNGGEAEENPTSTYDTEMVWFRFWVKLMVLFWITVFIGIVVLAFWA